jgi:hypothetical protein
MNNLSVLEKLYLILQDYNNNNSNSNSKILHK